MRGVQPDGTLVSGENFCPQCGERFSADVRECPDHEAALMMVGQGDDWAGLVFNEKFLLIRRLGSGRYGVVYEARHLKARAHLAVKILRDDSLTDPTIRKGFLKEAQATMNLRSDHIVGVRDIDEDPHGRLFIVMDLVAGCNLREFAVGKKLSAHDTLAIARQIALALKAAHGQQIVHRDLKPDNVLIALDDDGTPHVKVVDFSTAWRTVGDSGDTTEILHKVVGTPAYMSPEQCMATGVDERSDLYALGIIMYELLTGTRPIKAETSQGYLVAHVACAPEPIDETGVEVPPLLGSLIMRLLAKRPEERLDSAQAVLDAIEALAKPTRKVAVTPAVVKEAGGGMWAVVALCVVALGLGWWWKASSEPPTTAPSEVDTPAVVNEPGAPAQEAPTPAPAVPNGVKMEQPRVVPLQPAANGTARGRAPIDEIAEEAPKKPTRKAVVESKAPPPDKPAVAKPPTEKPPVEKAPVPKPPVEKPPVEKPPVVTKTPAETKAQAKEREAEAVEKELELEIPSDGGKTDDPFKELDDE